MERRVNGVKCSEMFVNFVLNVRKFCSWNLGDTPGTWKIIHGYVCITLFDSIEIIRTKNVEYHAQDWRQEGRIISVMVSFTYVNVRISKITRTGSVTAMENRELQLNRRNIREGEMRTFDAQKRDFRSIGRSINLRGGIRVWLYRTDDSIAMPLRHYSDLTTVRAWSWTNITFNHRPVPFLYNHGSKFSAFAGRRLVPSGSRTFRENSLERLSEFCVEDAVDDRIEGRVAVAEPSEYLLQNKFHIYSLLCFSFNLSFHFTIIISTKFS